MENKLEKVFTKAKYQANKDLIENTWHIISVKEYHKKQSKLWFFSVLNLISIIFLIPMLKILWNNLIQSGFFEYISLASNSNLIFNNFKEYALSIVESLPIISITLSLTLIFILFLSTKYMMKQIIIKNYAF